MAKRELASSSGSTIDHGADDAASSAAFTRLIRSRYHTVKTILCDEREEFTKRDSEKFDSIINEVESLYQHVHNPREQVADAEALLDIANTLVTSVKTHNKEGIAASDFVTWILGNFRQQSGPSGNGSSSVSWKDIGNAFSHILQRSPQCCTMIGPMNVEAKQRKAYQRNKRLKPTENDIPKELGDTVVEEEPETVKNVATMFNILRKNRKVRLENLVLNGNSFAQTVENLFALSFLVKDGRVEIKVNEEGHHLVSPRNAPTAKAIASGNVAYSHFVFRFDFKDFELMKEAVGDGDVLMPHRFPANISTNLQSEEPQETAGTTPIRMFSRSRGLVLREQLVGADSNQSIAGETPSCGSAAIRKRERKLT